MRLRIDRAKGAPKARARLKQLAQWPPVAIAHAPGDFISRSYSALRKFGFVTILLMNAAAARLKAMAAFGQADAAEKLVL